jgi:hypothetical protein
VFECCDYVAMIAVMMTTNFSVKQGQDWRGRLIVSADSRMAISSEQVSSS